MALDGQLKSTLAQTIALAPQTGMTAGNPTFATPANIACRCEPYQRTIDGPGGTKLDTNYRIIVEAAAVLALTAFASATVASLPGVLLTSGVWLPENAAGAASTALNRTRMARVESGVNELGGVDFYAIYV